MARPGPDPRKIDAYLRRQGSPLAGMGSKFVQVGAKYDIDPMLLVAISGAESSFGRNVKKGTFNPFGWGPHRPLGSWANAIDVVGKGLRTGYYDEGRDTPAEIQGKWAPSGAANDPTNLNSNWTRNVNKFLAELGGSSGPTAGGPPPAPHAITAPKGSATSPAGPAGLSQATLNLIFGDDPDFANTLSRIAQSRQPSPANPARQAGTPKPGKPSKTPALDQIKGEFGPQAMLAIIQQAQKLGLRVGENPYTDKVDPVHVKGSHHYRSFGKFNGKTLGRGADISGSPDQMAQIFKWIRSRYPQAAELIYDPIGASFDGSFRPGAYGGHPDHVHVGL